MRLNTKLFNAEGEQVNYHISKMICRDRTQISIRIEEVLVGEMLYSLNKEHLYIHRMANISCKTEAPFRNVGTLLIEYAFNISIKAGNRGKIELDAIGTSPAFYFKLGFRKKSYEGVMLGRLLAEYRATKLPLTAKKIQQSPFYKSLEEQAAKRLCKNPQELSLEEVIESGCYCSKNDEFKKRLATLPQGQHLTESDCYPMQGILFLSTKSIMKNKSKFESFKPIGSMFFWEATKIKNKKLLELVNAGKLDSSNAVEIESKIDENNPQWNILLSSIGLKMMKRNYISAWYMCVYIHNIDAFQSIISPNGFKAFEEGYIQHITQLVRASASTPTLLLSNKGMQLLIEECVKIDKFGCLTDSKGKSLEIADLLFLMNNKEWSPLEENNNFSNPIC